MHERIRDELTQRCHRYRPDVLAVDVAELGMQKGILLQEPHHLGELTPLSGWWRLAPVVGDFLGLTREDRFFRDGQFTG